VSFKKIESQIFFLFDYLPKRGDEIFQLKKIKKKIYFSNYKEKKMINLPTKIRIKRRDYSFCMGSWGWAFGDLVAQYTQGLASVKALKMGFQ
jgi:hypothetical protein